MDGKEHRCPECGCRWRLNPPSDVFPNGSWSLYDGTQKPGPCCDNNPAWQLAEVYRG